MVENRSFSADGNIQYEAITTVPYETESTIMHDVVTENFKSRVAKGEIINNPMDRTVENVYQFIPNYRRDFSSGWYNLGQRPDLNLYAPFLESSEDFATQREIAVTKAFSKVDSSIASIPVTLGELRETKEMLVKALISLRNFNKVLKVYRDKLKYALDKRGRTAFVADEILNGWMQVRFGWLPFVGDVKNLHCAMTALPNYQNRQTFRAGETFVDQAQDIYPVSLNSGSMTFDVNRTVYRVTNISAGVLCSQRYGGIPDTYGLTKFPSVLWELTRLSWAVDYFFNVGDVIASFTPDSLWSPLTSWVTQRDRVTCENYITNVYVGPPLFTGGYINNGRILKKYTKVQRFPSPGRSGINFRPRINWARYIDLVGVLKQPSKKLLKDVQKLYRRYKRR
jgi:hypothetical protein